MEWSPSIAGIREIPRHHQQKQRVEEDKVPTAQSQLVTTSSIDNASAACPMTEVLMQVPVPTPQATDNGRHCSAKMRQTTTVKIEITPIVPQRTKRATFMSARLVKRIRTKATAILAMPDAMM